MIVTKFRTRPMVTMIFSLHNIKTRSLISYNDTIEKNCKIFICHNIKNPNYIWLNKIKKETEWHIYIPEELVLAEMEEMREKQVIMASSPAKTMLFTYSPFQGSFGLSLFLSPPSSAAVWRSLVVVPPLLPPLSPIYT